MLEELAKKDKYWRKVALNICKDKELSDDLVQDMYIKLHNYQKQINDFFVIMVIRNLFLDVKKKKSIEVRCDYLDNLGCITPEYELDDKETELLNEFKKLNKEEQYYIEELYYKSYRQMASKDKGYKYIFDKTKNALKKILKEDYHLHSKSHYNSKYKR